ncbi:hypothetical protein GCM10010302_70220 [Streptomyces polychromogenes]|uniref:Uncharacterized protein n=1 Tax=Streptomyces polychromogenes TaxID=67342 RepID=A0ABP3FQZ0_9ACTN
MPAPQDADGPDPARVPGGAAVVPSPGPARGAGGPAGSFARGGGGRCAEPPPRPVLSPPRPFPVSRGSAPDPVPRRPAGLFRPGPAPFPYRGHRLAVLHNHMQSAP